MDNSKDHGNLTYFPGGKRKQECVDESASVSGEELLKTLQKPFESAGRNRRIERLRKKIQAGTYHISATELAERMIDGDNI